MDLKFLLTETLLGPDWKCFKDIVWSPKNKVNDDNNNILWINDEDLREFFILESTLYKDEPLSAGAGQGLYWLHGKSLTKRNISQFG